MTLILGKKRAVVLVRLSESSDDNPVHKGATPQHLPEIRLPRANLGAEPAAELSLRELRVLLHGSLLVALHVVGPQNPRADRARRELRVDGDLRCHRN